MKNLETYYKKLLTENRDEFREQTSEKNKNVITNTTNGNIAVEEIKLTLRTMKNNKSPGAGGIPIELIKYAPGQVIEISCKIFNKIMKGDELPAEWKKSFISSIYKKGNKKDCDNYRGIAVTSSIGRLYGLIIKKRLEKEIVEVEEKSEFRPGKSCVDNLYTLRQISEKCIARGKELHVVFIDLRRTYDSVPQIKLWKSMEKTNITKRNIEAIKRICKKATSQVKIGARLSAPFKTNKGLRQECPVSPTLLCLKNIEKYSYSTYF